MPGDRSSTWTTGALSAAMMKAASMRPCWSSSAAFRPDSGNRWSPGRDLVRGEQLLRQLTHAGAFLPDGDALAAQLGQPVETVEAVEGGLSPR